MKIIRTFMELSKSGIVTLVLISVLTGYLAGQSFEAPFQLPRLVLTLFGILLLASGSSALNQAQEYKIDAQMPRTQARPIPSGRIPLKMAFLFCAGSMGIGLWILNYLDTNLFWMGLFSAFSYNVLYTLWWKPQYPFAAIPGAVPGAMPIWMGFYAASNDLWNPTGLFLFCIVFYWQMPHFWVLALRFQNDYRAGAIPTLPVRKGEEWTRRHILTWTLGYIALTLGGAWFLKLGSIYLSLCLVTGIGILLALRKYWRDESKQSWLPFFLIINFSLIIYTAGLVLDQWSIHLIPGLSNWFSNQS